MNLKKIKLFFKKHKNQQQTNMFNQLFVNTQCRGRIIYSEQISLQGRLKSKKEGKAMESIQLSTTPDPGHHMGR